MMTMAMVVVVVIIMMAMGEERGEGGVHCALGLCYSTLIRAKLGDGYY